MIVLFHIQFLYYLHRQIEYMQQFETIILVIGPQYVTIKLCKSMLRKVKRSSRKVSYRQTVIYSYKNYINKSSTCRHIYFWSQQNYKICNAFCKKACTATFIFIKSISILDIDLRSSETVCRLRHFL